jgi:hypothetical protein
MASLHEYHDLLTKAVDQLPMPVSPEAVAFIEGYHSALEDLKMTWLTSALWHVEVTRGDLPYQVRTIREALESRLACVDTSAPARPAGSP